jgi:hypothetical protein
VSHHAFAKLEDFIGMALATSDVGHPQIARVHESNELRTFMVQCCIATHRIGRAGPNVGIPRRDVGTLFGEVIGITTMAIHAADLNRIGRMHIPDIGMAMNA